MRRNYTILLALVAALAVAVSALARLPQRAPAAEHAPPPALLTALAVAIEHGRITPESASVPKGNRVALHVTNRGAAPVDLSLAGYQDRVAVNGLGPGAEWRCEFLADLPGEDFAWIVNGQPAGRLAVTGSHLVEGHR